MRGPDLGPERNDVVDGKPGDAGVGSAGVRVRRLELAEGVFAVGGEMASDPLHAELVPCFDDVPGDVLKLLRGQRWEGAGDHETRHVGPHALGCTRMGASTYVCQERLSHLWSWASKPLSCRRSEPWHTLSPR